MYNIPTASTLLDQASRPSCGVDVSSSTTLGASWVPVKASTLKRGARGTTVAPSDCRAWLGWRGSVCCSHGGRFNSRWLPVCLFLVSVYLRLTPCLHVTHWHLPPGHIAEQASFLAGAAKKEKRIFSQRFKGRYVFRILSAEELKWLLLKKNKYVLQLLPLPLFRNLWWR